MTAADEETNAAAAEFPEPLPYGETVLWQGRPDWRHLARDAFHVRALWVYFALMVLWRSLELRHQGEGLAAVGYGVALVLPLVVIGLALVYLMAWLTARTTCYTVTTRRVVMRIGVVLDLTLNLPFQQLDAAVLRLAKDRHGEIALKLNQRAKIAYLHLWPHARPWRLAHPEPMLRGLANGRVVGDLLAEAMRADLERHSADVRAAEVVPLRARASRAVAAAC